MATDSMRLEGMPTHEGDLSIEGHGMDPIPESARYGSPTRLFTVWFTPNLVPAAFFIGTLVTLDFLKLGFATSFGASIDRAAVAGTVGLRYRLTENWLVGLDAGWIPWITTSPIKERNGVAMAYVTVIRRFPMRFDRVNLRTSAHLGVSTLLFDVYGAPMYSTGPYIALCPLGIDYDLGGAVRLVIDPVEFALPIPLVGQLPLYYEQVRFMVGLQFGS